MKNDNTTVGGDVESRELAPTSLWPIINRIWPILGKFVKEMFHILILTFGSIIRFGVGIKEVVVYWWREWVISNWKCGDWHGKAAVIEFFIIVPLLVCGLIASCDHEEFGSDDGSVKCESSKKDNRSSERASVWQHIKSCLGCGTDWTSPKDVAYGYLRAWYDGDFEEVICYIDKPDDFCGCVWDRKRLEDSDTSEKDKIACKERIKQAYENAKRIVAKQRTSGCSICFESDELIEHDFGIGGVGDHLVDFKVRKGKNVYDANILVNKQNDGTFKVDSFFREVRKLK